MENTNKSAEKGPRLAASSVSSLGTKCLWARSLKLLSHFKTKWVFQTQPKTWNSTARKTVRYVWEASISSPPKMHLSLCKNNYCQLSQDWTMLLYYVKTQQTIWKDNKNKKITEVYSSCRKKSTLANSSCEHNCFSPEETNALQVRKWESWFVFFPTAANAKHERCLECAEDQASQAPCGTGPLSPTQPIERQNKGLWYLRRMFWETVGVRWARGDEGLFC